MKRVQELGFLLMLFVILCCGKEKPANGEDPIEEETEVIEPLTREDILFANEFEDGHLNVWDDYDNNPAPDNVVLQDPGPFNKPGNHVMRLRVKEGRGGSDLVKMLPTQQDKVYARWYVMWEDGFDFTALNHGGGLFAGDRNLQGRSGVRPTGSDMVTMNYEHHKSGRPCLYTYYRGMYQDCTNPNGGCWGDQFPCFVDNGARYCIKPEHRNKTGVQTPKLETGKWYCVELLMDMGTPSDNAAAASGVFNMWIDGVEYGPWKNLWLRTTEDLKVSLFRARLYHHAEHSVEGMYIDNIVLAKKRIGQNKVIGE